MTGEVKVDRIRITIGKKTIDLTPEELKELREVLDTAFGKETVYLPGQPIVIERPTWPRPFERWHKPTWEYTTDRTGYIPKNSDYQTLCLSSKEATYS